MYRVSFITLVAHGDQREIGRLHGRCDGPTQVALVTAGAIGEVQYASFADGLGSDSLLPWAAALKAAFAAD
jgi:hypothetical protein